MDMRYKKKSLAFTYNEVSRTTRQAETLKTRESSRFKRLSLLRNLDEVNEEQSVEAVKLEEKKNPPSRLEMLFKWKKEKEIKKAIEKKNSKKPFYVGSQLKGNNSNMGFSSVPQPNANLFSSRIAKSRLVPPSSTQPAKSMNTTKQQPKVTSFQSSKIPNNFKPNGGKSTNVAKSNGVLSKNSQAFGNTAVSSTNQGLLPRIAQSTKIQDVKSAPNTRSGVKTIVKPQTVKSQVSALPKPTLTKQPNKPVLKTGIPSFPSNSIKGNSAQKMRNQKPVITPVSKIHEKVTPHSKENVSNKKKENCLKTALTKLPAMKKEAPSCSGKKREEKNNNINIHKKESIPELHVDNASKIFDCDISIIKSSQSFAPANFQFVPPTGLPDFSIDDEAFERIKTEVISRTSTPSKELKKSSSPAVKEACNDSSLIHSATDMSTNLLVEEILQRETDTNVPSGAEILPNEEKNDLELVDECTDFLAKVDLNKIQRILEEHRRLDKEDAESNSCNDLLDESKNAESAKAPDVSIDSPFRLVDLSDSDDICTKPLQLLKLDNEPISDKGLNKKENNQSTNISEDACVDSPLQIIDLNKIKRLSINQELEVLESEELINDKMLKKKSNQKIAVTKDAHVDSPLKIIDLNKIEKIAANNELEVLEEVLEEENLINVDDLCNQQDQDKYIKKKLDVHSKRSSMLKNVPVLNSIAEVEELEGSSSQAPNVYSKNKQIGTPSRRSRRLQQLVTLEENSSPISAGTPRRSLRRQNSVAKKCDFEEEILSPKPKSNLRRSIRLIDLNTPDKEMVNSPVSKTNITVDFERLTLTEPENINPHACLLDFDYSPVPKAKPRKVSLLYSPEKVRKSMRRSIRGDLISFSPSD